MKNNIYPWFNLIWKKLQKLKNNLPQSIIFYGNKGIGKKKIIVLYIKSLLCNNLKNNNYPCNLCKACILFNNNNHQNFYNLKIKKKNININEIKKIKKFINISYNNIKNYILIFSLNKLNIYASNAILKIIEEPKKNFFFFFITNNIKKIIQTILSRCYKFCLNITNIKNSISWLKKKNIFFKLNLKYFYKNPLLIKNYFKKKNKYNIFINQLINYKNILKNILIIINNIKYIPILNIINIYQKWLYDLILFKLTKNTYFYIDYKKKIKLIINNIKNILLIFNEFKKINKIKKKYFYFSNDFLIKKILIRYYLLFKI